MTITHIWFNPGILRKNIYHTSEKKYIYTHGFPQVDANFVLSFLLHKHHEFESQ